MAEAYAIINGNKVDTAWFNGREYGSAWLNGELIWGEVTQRPADQYSDWYNVYQINIEENDGADITVHQFGVDLKTSFGGIQLEGGTSQTRHLDKGQHIVMTTGTICVDKMHNPSEKYVKKILKCSLPTSEEAIPELKEKVETVGGASLFAGLFNCEEIDLSQLDLSSTEQCTHMFTHVGFNFGSYSIACKLKGLEYVKMFAPEDIENLFAFSNIDTTDYNWVYVDHQTRNMRGCFANYKKKELHIETWNTKGVNSYTAREMFIGVSDCKIYIGADWTLSVEPDALGGKNNTFIRVY
jgi:hypothetical protein